MFLVLLFMARRFSTWIILNFVTRRFSIRNWVENLSLRFTQKNFTTKRYFNTDTHPFRPKTFICIWICLPIVYVSLAIELPTSGQIMVSDSSTMFSLFISIEIISSTSVQVPSLLIFRIDFCRFGNTLGVYLYLMQDRIMFSFIDICKNIIIDIVGSIFAQHKNHNVVFTYH